MKNIDFSAFQVKKEDLNDQLNRWEYNPQISEYYKRLHKEEGDQTNYKMKSFRIGTCSYLWNTDYYEKEKVLDLKGTYTCKDKFCTYCKKMKQAVRMARYIPVLQEHENLYHMVLTVKSVKGVCVGETIGRMQKAFKQLINYFSGHDKIKDLDFQKFEFEGALRSLEVTYNSKGYHPHFHVVIKLNGSLSEKSLINTYSYDNRNGFKELVRLFSEEEVMIQKVWRLLYDGKRVSKKAIEDLSEGYSCMIDELYGEDAYMEIFKYITKGRKEIGEFEKSKGMSYKEFRNLNFGLHYVRQIQGYGCFYNLAMTEKEEEYELDRLYNDLLGEGEMMKMRIEKAPKRSLKTLAELNADSENTIIQRRRTIAYLKQIYNTSDD